jgi:molybdenum cofactor synthesis domain-containing protein
MEAFQPIQATIVTVSDEVHSGMDGNRAGQLAVELLGRHEVRTHLVVVPDDIEQIRSAVTDARQSGSRLVMTSGGTGIGPSDLSVDAIAPLLDYQVPGICEEIRRRGAATVASALVSREVAGVIRGNPPTFVITAPGSRGGVRDAIDVLGPLLGHIVAQLDGAGHI